MVCIMVGRLGVTNSPIQITYKDEPKIETACNSHKNCLQLS